MTLCNILYGIQKAFAATQNCLRAACCLRASVWTTLYKGIFVLQETEHLVNDKTNFKPFCCFNESYCIVL